MKMQATITGSKLHGVGYRAFLLNQAFNAGMQRFYARNLKRDELQQVIVRVEGESNQIESFSACIRKEHPPDAVVSDITFQEYTGYVTSIHEYWQMRMVELLTQAFPLF
ncbi:MAG: acylphosphatase [Methanoregula sp.]|jgi:acylphosphatase|nr:acylphosphatase [Methanoregula sp.]